MSGGFAAAAAFLWLTGLWSWTLGPKAWMSPHDQAAAVILATAAFLAMPLPV